MLRASVESVILFAADRVNGPFIFGVSLVGRVEEALVTNENTETIHYLCWRSYEDVATCLATRYLMDNGGTGEWQGLYWNGTEDDVVKRRWLKFSLC